MPANPPLTLMLASLTASGGRRGPLRRQQTQAGPAIPQSKSKETLLGSMAQNRQSDEPRTVRLAAGLTSEPHLRQTEWPLAYGFPPTCVNAFHYFGPCGSANDALHHYVITVIATEIEPGKLMPGLTYEELVQALRGHALAPASIVGRYTRPSQ